MRGTASAIGLARIAVVLSAAALLVSLSGVTPAQAVRAVKRALNADKVDGISASRKPTPGKLLPLGSNGRFPDSVLSPVPRGPRGAQGIPGPSGPAGPPGLAVVRVGTGAAREMPRQPESVIDVARLDNLSPGNWLLTFTATLVLLDGGFLTSAQCSFIIAGKAVPGGTGGVGGQGSATHALVLAGTATTTQATPFEVVLRCSQNHDLTASSQPLTIDAPRIVAIRADSLETTGG
jgi:hypothetical protein